MKYLIFIFFFCFANLTYGQTMSLSADLSVLPVINSSCQGSGFGREVVISDSMAIVGAQNIWDGTAVIFNKDASGNWVNSQTISPFAFTNGPSSSFGSAIDIGSDYIVFGNSYDDYDQLGSNYILNAGAAFIYIKDSLGNWVEHQKIVASNREFYDSFGEMVNVSGDFIFVSARYDDDDELEQNEMGASGAVYVYQRDQYNQWNQIQKIVSFDRRPGDGFGYSLDSHENQLIVGTISNDLNSVGADSINEAGAAYIYSFDSLTGLFQLDQKIVASDRASAFFNQFGWDVAIHNNRVAVAKRDTVYSFQFDSLANYWVEDQIVGTPLLSTIALNGFKVSLNNQHMVIGAGNSAPGRAYLYNKQSGVWQLSQTFFNTQPNTNTQFGAFGQSVNLSESALIVGDSRTYIVGPGWSNCNAGGASIFEYCQSSSYQVITTCGSYTSPSGTYEWTQGGIYSDIIQNSFGCDSIITTDLTIISESNSVIFETVCDTYTSPSGLYQWSSSGTYFDTLNGASMNGCDSIVQVNLTVSSSSTLQTIEACDSYEWLVNGQTFQQSGYYSDTLINDQGCDSILVLDLTINTVNTDVTQIGDSTINANLSGQQYQWLDCGNNFSPLSGATNQTYNAIQNGSYAVEITQNGCIDTSTCVTIASLNVIEEYLVESINIQPNPAHDIILISGIKQNFRFGVLNLIGQEVFSGWSNEEAINVNELSKGTYFLVITTNNRAFKEKFVKL